MNSALAVDAGHTKILDTSSRQTATKVQLVPPRNARPTGVKKAVKNKANGLPKRMYELRKRSSRAH